MKHRKNQERFRIESGYVISNAKVEIHISPRANKKLLSPRALSFAFTSERRSLAKEQ